MRNTTQSCSSSTRGDTLGYKPTVYNNTKPDLDSHLLGKGNQHVPDAGSTTSDVSAKEVFYKRGFVASSTTHLASHVCQIREVLLD